MQYHGANDIDAGVLIGLSNLNVLDVKNGSVDVAPATTGTMFTRLLSPTVVSVLKDA
jgi:hypothetical protein